MRTDARTPGRSRTFVQRLPRGRATAAASTPSAILRERELDRDCFRCQRGA
jgi:hypothetical protein